MISFSHSSGSLPSEYLSCVEGMSLSGRKGTVQVLKLARIYKATAIASLGIFGQIPVLPVFVPESNALPLYRFLHRLDLSHMM